MTTYLHRLTLPSEGSFIRYVLSQEHTPNRCVTQAAFLHLLHLRFHYLAEASIRKGWAFVALFYYYEEMDEPLSEEIAAWITTL